MFRFEQVKQSSVAPLAGALRLLLRWGAVGGSVLPQDGGGHASGKVMVTDRNGEGELAYLKLLKPNDAHWGRVVMK